MHSFLRLLKLLKPYWKRLVLAAVCLTGGTIAALFPPLVWKYVVDQVILADKPKWIEYVGTNSTDGRVKLLLAALGVMFVVYMAGVILRAARTYLVGVIGQRFVFDLRLKVYAKIQSHSLQFFHKRRSGDLIARAMGDIDTLEQVVRGGSDEIITSAIQFIAVAGIIIWLNVIVGLLTLVPLIGVAIAVVIFNTKVKKLYRAVRDRLGDISAKLQENISGMLVIKSFGHDKEEIENFLKRNKAYYDTSIRAVVARALYFPSVASIGFLSNMVMLGVGGFLILLKQFTVGDLVAYRSYWWQLFSPVNTLSRTNEMIQRAIAAAKRIFEILDEPLEIEDAVNTAKLENIDGSVCFKNVSFSHSSRDSTLSNINFDIPNGAQVGIVGPSGAGKSTLLSLLLRLYETGSGAIEIDGRNIKDVTQTSLRQQFGVVTQEPFLFSGTIRDNITYVRPQADENSIHQAARQANIHEFIINLPEGYDTKVGERGVRLSGGQKQRICIARALIAKPKILLLDEATASVEPESESIIQAALQKVQKGRTSLVISHRLSMVRDADILLVVEDGKITERGTHDKLMAKGGWYSKMYKLQMSS